MLTQVGQDLSFAIQLLSQGEVVALPTETVYGLAANALNEQAVAKIYEAKNRPSFNPLIIHIAEHTPLEIYAKDIPEQALILAEKFWPGPLTLLLSKRSSIPELVTAGSSLVAIRKPSHPLMRAVLKELSFPLAAPSANPSGYISPTTAAHVKRQLNGRIPYILDGATSHVGLESTIVGFPEGKPTIYRHGGVTQEVISQVLGSEIVTLLHSDSPNSPGMLKSHYAPNISLHLGDIPELLHKFSGKKIGVISFQENYEHPDIHKRAILSANGDLREAASKLFSVLHQMDQWELDVILAEKVPERGLGKAINDRLTRAMAILKGE